MAEQSAFNVASANGRVRCMTGSKLPHPWIARRTTTFDGSGIRRIFDLAATMKDPVDLSIGQPHFEVPKAIQKTAVEAITTGRNGYSATAGIAPLRQKLQSRIDQQLGHTDRQVLVTSGTSGGIVLAMMALVNPGDEIIVFDPYFVIYQPLIQLVGGKCVLIDTYPDFTLNIEKVAAAITQKTKLILLNSPNNPTGHTVSAAQIQELAELAKKENIVLLSDEIYQTFCYDSPFTSPALFNPQTLVVDGFSKTYGITGWRIGFAHGPAEIIDVMTRIQPYTYVCAPQPAQWAATTALDVDMSEAVTAYRHKRDLVVNSLADRYSIPQPGGAFYLFPKVPKGTASEFVARAIERNLLIIPGSVFSQRDTHFRISYAVSDAILERGIEILRKLA